MTTQRGRLALTRTECIFGWIFFCLYFLLLPFVVSGLRFFFVEQWAFDLGDALSSLVYHFAAALLALFLFWDFLKASWARLQGNGRVNCYAFASGLTLWLVLRLLLSLVPLPVSNPANASYAAQLSASFGPTLLILLFLIPFTEELLFRGLVFTSIRKKGALPAWCASVFLFCLFHTWQFVFTHGDWRYGFLFFLYLPAGLALTWCRVRSSSLFVATLLHGVINGLFLFFLPK